MVGTTSLFFSVGRIIELELGWVSELDSRSYEKTLWCEEALSPTWQKLGNAILQTKYRILPTYHGGKIDKHLLDHQMAAIHGFFFVEYPHIHVQILSRCCHVWPSSTEGKLGFSAKEFEIKQWHNVLPIIYRTWFRIGITGVCSSVRILRTPHAKLRIVSISSHIIDEAQNAPWCCLYGHRTSEISVLRTKQDKA